MYSRNATRVPTLIAPEVTRAPPTARMARNAHCTDRPAVFPAIACHLAARMSARHAWRAAAWMRSPSRRSAPDALMVRNAPSIRSSAAPITPTEFCAWRAALADPGHHDADHHRRHTEDAHGDAEQHRVQKAHQDQR